jgi:hypothetical protein
MENLNQAFFFFFYKIIDMQGYFIKQALNIGKLTLLTAVLSAALNYAISGAGLKENVIKIMKATVFFLIVIAAYPKIIGFISSWTFDLASASMYPSVKQYYDSRKEDITNTVEEKKYGGIAGEALAEEEGRSAGGAVNVIEKASPDDPLKYFDDMIVEIHHARMAYSAVPPAAVFKLVLLVAKDCFNYADKAGRLEFGKALKGTVCAFFIILTGIFAVLEYLMAFLEFMLVSSVGVILFPLSIWEGSRFMSEKFVGAIIGFFVKLLFCNIAIFLMLYGFITLSWQFASRPFGGLADEIISVLFICLLFFYICKSAPGLAQSLLTGVPSLSAAGAVSAAGGALAAAGTRSCPNAGPSAPVCRAALPPSRTPGSAIVPRHN